MNTPFRLAATATLSCGFLFVIIQQLSCPAPRTNRAAISTKCDAECSLGQLRARLGLTIQPRPWALSDYEPADGATLARWGNTPCWKVAKQTPFDTDALTRATSLPNSSAFQIPCTWKQQLPQGAQSMLHQENCGPFTGSYKIHNGILWLRGNQTALDYHIASRAESIHELLLAVLHVYKHVLPPLDFVIDYGDSPEGCKIPVLGFALPTDGTEAGCAMPDPDAWTWVAGSKPQLSSLVHCLKLQYSENKKKKVFFRGSSTGLYRQHGPHGKNDLLLNSRVFAATIARNAPYMDVKITNTFWPDAGQAYNATQKALFLKVMGITAQPTSTVEAGHEEGSSYAGTLILEGNGYLNRIPATLLSGSVMLLQHRPLAEWYLPSLTPGQHFVQVRYDLSDLLLQGKHVSTGGPAWVAMAERAQNVAYQLFTARATIDALAAALMQYKSLTSWETAPPDHHYTMVRHGDWKNPFLSDAAKGLLEAENPYNFKPYKTVASKSEQQE